MGTCSKKAFGNPCRCLWAQQTSLLYALMQKAEFLPNFLSLGGRNRPQHPSHQAITTWWKECIILPTKEQIKPQQPPAAPDKTGTDDPAKNNGRTFPASFLEAGFPKSPNTHCICAICRCAILS